MAESTHVAPSKGLVWTGYVLSTLPVLMLLMSAGFKILQPEFFTKEWVKSGFTENHATGIGIVEILCTLLYVIPQTSVLGAILLTGYLGGATATHVRMSEPWFGPVLFGVVIWLGLFLREKRLWALIPIRTKP